MHGYFEIIYITWMNDGFLLDVGVKQFYTDVVCPLNSLTLNTCTSQFGQRVQQLDRYNNFYIIWTLFYN
jgi:hypothetical protein